MPGTRPSKRASLRAPSPPLLGWREFVTLPELGLGPLVAKVDTGARTAALHALNVTVALRGAERHVRFDAVVDEVRHRTRACDLPLHGVKRVRNPGGAIEDRFVVETDLMIGTMRWRTLVTLTDRADMGVPMLIGRAAIKGRFCVDPGRSFLMGRSGPARRRKGPQ